RRWSYLVACLLAGAVLGACQGTDTLRLANLPASDPVTLAPVVNETGRSLSLPPDNPLAVLRLELGLGDEKPVTVADVLLNRLVLATLGRGDDSEWVDTRAVFVSMDVVVARISDGEVLDSRVVSNLAVPVGAATTIVQATDDAARWLAERLF